MSSSHYSARIKSFRSAQQVIKPLHARHSVEMLEPRRLLSASEITPQIIDDPYNLISPDFQLNTRWSSTASGGTGSLGQGITLTYSIVPDGTMMVSGQGEPTAASDLRARLNVIYGNMATWLPIVQQVFGEWSAISGITYVYEPNDDGVQLTTAAGVLGVRGDVRIGAHPIDGASGILAYNYFPNNSDMTLDSSDLAAGGYMFDTSNSSRKLRNVMAHEHGHGLGFSHVDPTNQTKLMEAFVSTAYDGPQYDDMSAVQRDYGDFYEKGSGNNTSANAVNLGTIGATSTTTNVSLSTTSDVDFYEITVNQNFFINLSPFGPTYQQGSQGGATSSYNGSSQMDLQLQLLASDGTTVLQTANATGVGGSEQVIPPGSGTYYLKVMPAPGASNLVQTYNLGVVLDPPPAPSAPDMASGSDSGTSNGDNVTNVTTPSFSGTATVGTTVTLYAGVNLVGQTTADASGNWTIVSSALADNTYSMTATATNPIGPSGSSSPLGITIDTVAPPVPGTPDLAFANDTGQSHTDNVTNVTNPSFSGSAQSGSSVKLFANAVQVGAGMASGGNTYNIVSGALSDGPKSMTATATDLAGNVSSASGALSATIDTTRPSISSTVFNYLTAQQIVYSFSENVAWTTNPFSITITNTADSSNIDNGNIAESDSTGNTVATFTFPGYANSSLPDGNYEATVSGIQDVAGNAMLVDPSTPLPFFALAGDADRSKTVDTVDFNILVSNFSQPGKNFGDGDFNYDTSVDTIDFNILAANFSNFLPAPTAAAAPSVQSRALPLAPAVPARMDDLFSGVEITPGLSDGLI